MKKIRWEILLALGIFILIVYLGNIKVGANQQSVFSLMLHDFGFGCVAVWELLIKPALEFLF